MFKANTEHFLLEQLQYFSHLKDVMYTFLTFFFYLELAVQRKHVEWNSFDGGSHYI